LVTKYLRTNKRYYFAITWEIFGEYKWCESANAFRRCERSTIKSDICKYLFKNNDSFIDLELKIKKTIHEAHNRQLEILRAAIAEERREFAKAQLVK
jgi:hypothetical protein